MSCCHCPSHRPLRPLVLLLALVVGLCVVTHLLGCATSLMARTPLTQSLALSGRPQDAYSQAVQAAARYGVQVQVTDPTTRMVAGVVHGAVQLTIVVDDQSTVHVTCQLLPGKLVVGQMTECEDYLALLRKDVADAR